MSARSCIGFLGRLFGHAHQPRYSTVRKSYEWVARLGGGIFRNEIPADEEKRMYHGDVCARCGDVVNVPSRPTGGAAVPTAAVPAIPGDVG